ncbi:hypothetical protein KSF73_13880 [Burkholderiaceae bacterium DAT-1]|nr:hypothetical protein [Burkholderiaceae bacterium DAT-1]
MNETERRLAYLAWSDRESGSHRQWVFLELAAQLQTTDSIRSRTHLFIWLIEHLPLAFLAPIIRYCGLKGMHLYALPPHLRQTRYLNWLIAGVSLLMMLQVYRSDTALIHSIAIMLCVLASLFGYVLGWWQARTQCLLLADDYAERELTLPDPETSLGFAGAITGAGLPLEQAGVLLAEIAEGRAPQDTLDALCLSAPGVLQHHLNAVRHALFAGGIMALGAFATALPWPSVRLAIYALLPALCRLAVDHPHPPSIKRSIFDILIPLSCAILALLTRHHV